MKLVLLPDPQALAVHVAEWLSHKITLTSRPLRIALSGGSTPKAMFDVLAMPKYQSLDWSQVQLFWGDERFVPPDHPDSNYGAARDRLLSKIKIPDANIHPIQCDGTPAEAASRYQQTLQTAYGATELDPGRPLFDVTFLGLGEDGHTASLLPGQPVLDEKTDWVAEVSQGRPETRITLTYPAIESSAVVAFLVTGAGKRSVLARARAGDPSLPAGRLHPNGELIWFADRAAGGA
jgi:6-phosphogluconolactonase